MLAADPDAWQLVLDVPERDPTLLSILLHASKTGLEREASPKATRYESKRRLQAPNRALRHNIAGIRSIFLGLVCQEEWQCRPGPDDLVCAPKPAAKHLGETRKPSRQVMRMSTPGGTKQLP